MSQNNKNGIKTLYKHCKPHRLNGHIINPDGTPNVSVITSLGLVTLPIHNDQIAEKAGIPESKLKLDYPTTNLFNC